MIEQSKSCRCLLHSSHVSNEVGGDVFPTGIFPIFWGNYFRYPPDMGRKPDFRAVFGISGIVIFGLPHFFEKILQL